MRALIEPHELWVSIDGYDGIYQVSNHGRVRSVDRKELMHGRHEKPYYRFRNGKYLTPALNNKGYLQVLLHKNGIGVMESVHRLVAKAFVPNPNLLPEVNHINEVKTENWADNLEWVSRSQNAKHSSHKFRGSNSGTSKLKELDVLAIVKMLEDGHSQKLIASEFNVTNHTIHKIKSGENWSWLTGLDKEGGT